MDATTPAINRDRIFPIGLMVSGLATVATGSMTTVQPAIPAVVAVGLGAGVAWVTIFTLLQERTDDRLRGRTFATLQTGIQLSLFVGLAGWPLIAGAVGNHTVETAKYFIDLSGTRIVIWGGGRIWRVAAASGEATQIPFTAEVEQTVVHALRFPVDVAPDRFPVRMLRHVTVSPDGRIGLVRLPLTTDRIDDVPVLFK